MARKLSVRERDGSYEVGPTGHGPTVSIQAPNKQIALRLAKKELRERDRVKGADGRTGFAEAVRQSYRFTKKIDTIPAPKEVV